MIYRSSVSVVMATYNGQMYIREQVDSILVQLHANDELVVVDDCSQDYTAKILKEYNDNRIKFILNSHNVGVIKSFEIGIEQAKNELIFLSDQDDIWSANKVDEITHVLNDQSVTLVYSDACIIDSCGKKLHESFKKLKNFEEISLWSNIIRNQVLGCTIAFRSNFKNKLIPFPKMIPMHDMWIVNLALIYGKVVFINKPLILYRRHEKNVTAVKSKFSILKKLRFRFCLIYSLIGRYLNVF